MKLTGIILLAGVLQVSATGKAQTVTYSGKAAPLAKVLSVIEEQTGYNIFYNETDLQASKPVTVRLNAVPLRDALDQILAGQPLKFDIQGNTISLMRQERVTLHLKGASLKTVLDKIQEQTGYSYAFAGKDIRVERKLDVDVQNVTIEQVLDQCLRDLPVTYEVSGKMIKILRRELVTPAMEDAKAAPAAGGELVIKVISEDGTRLVGASIRVKALRLEGITNEKGELIAKGIPEGRYHLEVTYVGYQVYEGIFEVSGNTSSVFVSLKQAVNNLDQVQIIAYGQTTQRLSTGDETTVHSEDIEKQPVGNVLAAIEGRVPGLFVTQQSGMPGSSFSVQIRGQNSIINGNDPFYVIDGVPYTSELFSNSNLNPSVGNPLDFINPTDIESITVLKDADATAIYGSRAANGAILITTKKGKSGKTRVDVNASDGIAMAPSRAKWLNNSQYLTMRHEAFANDSVQPDQYSGPDLFVWDTTRNTDWQKLLIGGTARYTNIGANLSGGNSNTVYLFGADYHNETTVFPITNTDKKVALHLNLENTSDDKRFKFNLTANYLVDNRNLPNGDPTTYSNEAPVTPPIHNSDGSLNWANSTWQNPWGFTLQKYIANTNNLISSATISYNISKGLYIKSNFGYTDLQLNEISTLPMAAQNPAYGIPGMASFTVNNIHSWIAEPQISYQFLAGRGRFETLIGSTFEQQTTNGQQLNGSGYTSDELLESTQAAPILSVASQTNAVYDYNAIFGRVNYNLADKYIVNLEARRDGSSRFGPDNQFHDFASAGGAWIFSKEAFFKKGLPFLSFGKLHASYGSTGNDQIGNYQFYSLYATSAFPYQNSTVINPVGLSNPTLQWELTRKLEGGLSLGLAKDRVLFEANYYVHRSSNQLLSSTLPTITGFSSIPMNLPATVENSGWEFSINTTNVSSKDFKWKSVFSLSANQNKLVAFPGLSTNPNFEYSYVIGKPVTGFKTFHSTGVDPQTGLYAFTDSLGKPTLSPSYTQDRVGFVNPAPKFYGGFLNSFMYRGWQLDVFIKFTKQLGSNPLFQQFLAPGMGQNNNLTAVMSRWRNPGDHSSIERFTQDFGSPAFTAYQNAQESDIAWIDASFIRLSNVSLSYQIPAGWIKRMRLRSLQLYLHGQNLLTITKYKGMDPETQSLSRLPLLRVITAGIQISL